MTTVQQSQADFLARIKEGIDCPVCDRYVKIYPYTVGMMLTKLLEAIYLRFGMQWVPRFRFPTIVTDKAPKGKCVTNYSMLKHFGLLERNPEKSAEWRVTQLGESFIRGGVEIPCKIIVCLDQLLSQSSEHKDFDEAKSGRRVSRKLSMSDTNFCLPKIPTSDVDLTLADAISRHKFALDRGIHCVVCGRYNQIYKRVINSEMARILADMAKVFETAPPKSGYLHVYNQIGARCGEYAQMQFWGLIEPSSESGGEWRPTVKGLEFARGEATVRSHVITLNDKVIGFDGKQITIADAHKTPFTKNELISPLSTSA